MSTRSRESDFPRDFKKKKILFLSVLEKKKIKSGFPYLSGIYLPRRERLLRPSPAAVLGANGV